jgi:hypothetical protein
MKTLKNDLISKAVLAIVCGLSICFSSCSNDDDDNGSSGSGVKTCYSIVDGQKDTYKYAYYYRDTENENNKELTVIFTNLDYPYYAKHLDKAASAESAEVMLSLYTTDYQIPTGSIGSTYYDVEVDRKHKISDEETPFQCYVLYGETWTHKEAAKLVITKDGDTYKMELKDADFLANDPTSSDYLNFNTNSRKTTGSLEFEGSLTDITSLMN